ncbi:MAG: UvrD-helicase domain-containing protein, partial [Bacilli bacterium]|nr:UvrD-helicase domain-containing protein [Bacilli bacterium]
MPNWTKEQQEAIYQKGKNIIVSAGAGSGKTAVLTERVITHLKEGVSIDELLILTFTNAAAQEMKDRIRKKIKENKDLLNNLDKIDNAYITTFDAYALSLVKKYSHILNISKDIKIADNTFIDIKKEEILNDIFEHYYKEKNNLFLKLIDDFSIKDDKEIFKNILTLYNKISNTFDKEDYLKNYIKNYYTEENIEKYIKEYEEYLKDKIKEIKNIEENLSLYVDGSYIEKLNLENLYNSNTYEEIKENITSKLPRLPSNSEEEAKNIKKELTKTLKTLEELTKYESSKQIKETIYKTKDYAEIISKILLELDKKLNKYKEENNVYEFIDISSMAINLLKQNEEVREKLKEKYYEIMIDEYQDTNDLQELFVSLIEKNNVYMVGDIKQSIYRFRNTNPILFKDKYNLYQEGEKGLKIDLNKNFRSRKEVLTGINYLFDYIMDENIGGAEYRLSHRMIYGNTTYEKANKENYKLEILNYIDEDDFTKEEIEIFTVANDIKNKINSGYEIMDKESWTPRKVKYEDFAILMDRSSSFEKYKKIFEYLKIPLNIYRDKSITDNIDILLIKNIYNLILSIHSKKYDDFKYSYMSISRSYLEEKTDDEIIEKINNIKETKIFEICKELSQNIEETTNYKLIEEIINKFNFYENIIKDGNIHEHIIALDSIKKIAQSQDELGYTPYDFYNYLNEVLEKGLDIKVKINKGDKSAVKIMTIHASKGLEYPICYYTGLSKKFNIDDLKNKFYFDKKYGIITPYIDEKDNQTIIKDLLKNEYIKEEISEKLRLFYVALTRAREKMIIVTSIKPKDIQTRNVIEDSIRLSYRSFKDIIDSASTLLEDYIINIDNEKLNLTKKYNLSNKKINLEKFKYGDKLIIETPNIETKEIDTKHFSKTVNKLLTREEDKNIKLGLHMHEVFENFNFKKEDYTNLDNFEKQKIKAFINTKILENTKEIYKEYEFIDEEYHGII